MPNAKYYGQRERTKWETVKFAWGNIKRELHDYVYPPQVRFSLSPNSSWYVRKDAIPVHHRFTPKRTIDHQTYYALCYFAKRSDDVLVEIISEFPGAKLTTVYPDHVVLKVSVGNHIREEDHFDYVAQVAELLIADLGGDDNGYRCIRIFRQSSSALHIYHKFSREDLYPGDTIEGPYTVHSMFGINHGGWRQVPPSIYN